MHPRHSPLIVPTVPGQATKSTHKQLQVQKVAMHGHAIGTRANKPNQVRCFAHVSMQHATCPHGPWLLWLLLSCHSNRKPQAVPPLLSSSAKMTRFLCTIKCRARQCPTVQGPAGHSRVPDFDDSASQPQSPMALCPRPTAESDHYRLCLL